MKFYLNNLVPGVSQFIPLSTPQDSPANNILKGITQEDLTTIHSKKLILLSLNDIINVNFPCRSR